MNVLKHEKKLGVLGALVEGNSVRAVSRMTGVHKTTILRLINDVGTWCARVMDEQMRNLRCAEIEADEVWCFVGKRQWHLTPEEKQAGELGDAYTFVAFDPVTKLVPVIRVRQQWRRESPIMSGTSRNLWPDRAVRNVPVPVLGGG